MPPSCKASKFEASLMTQLLLSDGKVLPSWVDSNKCRCFFTVWRNSPDNLQNTKWTMQQLQQQIYYSRIRLLVPFISSPSLSSVSRISTLRVLRTPLSTWSLSIPTALCTQLRTSAVVSTTWWQPCSRTHKKSVTYCKIMKEKMVPCRAKELHKGPLGELYRFS